MPQPQTSKYFDAVTETCFLETAVVHLWFQHSMAMRADPDKGELSRREFAEKSLPTELFAFAVL